MVESSRRNSCLIGFLIPSLMADDDGSRVEVQLTGMFELRRERWRKTKGHRQHGGNETFMHLGTLCIRSNKLRQNEVWKEGFL